MRRRNGHDARMMKPGDELSLEITDVAYGGAGLGRHEGRVVFIPFTIPGETVRVRLDKVTRNWMQARVIKIITASPDRVAPPCPLFRRCGGCAYQHIAYPRQLEIKTQQVAETLRRIGKFPDPPVEPARPSPLAYAYRNRITVHVVPPVIGFRGTDPREVVDVKECLLAAENVNAALAALRSKKRLRPGPATLRSGPAGTGFRQVNDQAAEVLAGVVQELAGRGGLLLDAYCGAGFFAKKLLGQFTRVVGLDWDRRSIDTARADAGPSEEYHAGDAAELLPELLTGARDAVVLVDPPAQGLAEDVIAALLKIGPPRIVYVSCDPATLARDLAKLRAGYELQRTVPVDMFPQTASIETVCRLEARSAAA
jgi:tRNA/tmRNA/rRNA uracil-C5-methylase (TrmA/RlmC/RlmD family)